jgi:hypothetical protein
MPKFNFALRSLHPEDIKEAALEFDDIKLYYSGIERVLGNHRIINTADRLRMYLTISLSGLGLPLAQNVAPAAYCGSKIYNPRFFLKKTNRVDEAR